MGLRVQHRLDQGCSERQKLYEKYTVSISLLLVTTRFDIRGKRKCVCIRILKMKEWTIQ
ncbi:Uncharacterised protein [Segatella copri]|nr:Uncharacterised protein [Segatella copri]